MAVRADFGPRLGLAYKQFGESVPLFKRLGGRFLPKNSPFRRRVEKVGLSVSELFFPFWIVLVYCFSRLQRSSSLSPNLPECRHPQSIHSSECNLTNQAKSRTHLLIANGSDKRAFLKLV
jgi:hypothetical protein